MVQYLDVNQCVHRGHHSAVLQIFRLLKVRLQVCSAWPKREGLAPIKWLMHEVTGLTHCNFQECFTGEH